MTTQRSKEDEEIKIYDKNHPARIVFDNVCWRKFGQTFNDLCENEGNQQSGFWLSLILPAMQEYSSQFIQEIEDLKEKLKYFKEQRLPDAENFIQKMGEREK